MSGSVRAGLVLFGVLSAADLATPLLTDGEHPPMAVALVAALLGLASLVLVISAWRGAQRAMLPLVGLRVLSALAAVPAFFGGVPAVAMIAGGVLIGLTVLGVVLVIPALRRPSPVGAR